MLFLSPVQTRLPKHALVLTTLAVNDYFYRLDIDGGHSIAPFFPIALPISLTQRALTNNPV
jgi:hypothetical protein